MRKSIPVFAALIGAACFATPAAAASFDCSLARRADEATVCRTPALSALDSEMGGLWYAYSRVPMFMGGNGARMDAAEAFLARRRACGRNVGCLTGIYRARIVALRRGLDAAMEDYRRLQNG
ncbi:MAG TPA: hypothetical protein VMG08_06100 [Allosphingosinicella sp.]|nr:hypothetical protein [Allosphingosinicella sp.]